MDEIDAKIFNDLLEDASNSDVFVFMPMKIEGEGDGIKITSDLQLIGRNKIHESYDCANAWLACLDAVLQTALRSADPVLVMEILTQRVNEASSHILGSVH